MALPIPVSLMLGGVTAIWVAASEITWLSPALFVVGVGLVATAAAVARARP